MRVLGRHWLEYDSVAVAVLIIGTVIVLLIALTFESLPQVSSCAMGSPSLRVAHRDAERMKSRGRVPCRTPKILVIEPRLRNGL